MKWREQKDRFLFIGERLLNAFVTILYLCCIVGVGYIFITKAASSIIGAERFELSFWEIILILGLLAAFLALRAFSKYLEKKHFEYKEIVFGMDMLKGDLYRMQQNQKDPNYVPVPVKRGSLEPKADLATLIGLQSVKDKMEKLDALYSFEKTLSKKERQQSQQINRHYAFIGNPGTGKTTVARIFAGLLYKNERIKRNIYVECTGNDLISEFAGDTKNRIAKIYNKARNGVLFIDEAYALAQAEERGPEAVAQLLTYMENDPTTVVIFAGYKFEMEQLLAMNSGLSSRISQKIDFDDYTPSELLSILGKFLKERNMVLDSNAEWLMLQLFGEKIKICNATGAPFSNGRYARNCFDAIYQQHAINYKNTNESSTTLITETDVKPILNELLALD